MNFEKYLSNKLKDFDAGYDSKAWDAIKNDVNADNVSKNSLSNYDAGYDAQAWKSISSQVAKNNRIFKLKAFVSQLKYAGIFAGVIILSTVAYVTQKPSKINYTSTVELTTPSKVEIKKQLTNKTVDLPKINKVKTEPNTIIKPKLKGALTAKIKSNAPNIKKETKLPASLAISKTELCFGEPLEIKINGYKKGQIIKIGNKRFNKSENTYYFNKDGQFEVALFDNQENVIQKVNVKVRPKTNASFDYNKSNKTADGTTVLTSALATNHEHKWFVESKFAGSNNTMTYTFNHKGKYQIKHVVIDNYGCKDSSTETIRVLRAYNLMASQIFNPNKSKWLPLGLKRSSKQFELTVISPQGEKVFTSNSKDHEWDGIEPQTGKLAKDGDEYFWIAKVKNQEGKTSEFGGSFIISSKL